MPKTQIEGGSCLNSGSICPSSPFERELSFAGPSKRAPYSQSFWRLWNTDAPMYLHRWAVSPALRSRSSEIEKTRSDRMTASSFFQNFRPVDPRSPTVLWDIPTDVWSKPRPRFAWCARWNRTFPRCTFRYNDLPNNSVKSTLLFQLRQR